MKSFFFTILLLFSLLLSGKSPQTEKNYLNFNVKPHFLKKNDKNISKIRFEAYFSAENLPKARLKLPEIYNTHPDEVRNNPKYNSQELDRETNFYFYNARYYDPQICRFVTADNIVDGELSAVGWNRYAYVKGNPVVGKDPTGHANENSWLMDQTIGVSHEQHVKQQEAVNEVSSEIADKTFTVLTGGRADSGTLDPVDINGIDRTPALEVEPFDIYLLGKIVKGGLSFAKNKLKKSIVKKTIKNGNFKSKLKEALRGNSELGGVKVSGRGKRDIVLGTKNTLKSTMKKHGGHYYKDWMRAGLTKYDPTDMKQFKLSFREAVDNCEKINFSLDGFNLKTAIKKGKKGPFKLEKNVTNWEFNQILDNDKTIFWQNGKKVDHSRVLERISK